MVSHPEGLTLRGTFSTEKLKWINFLEWKMTFQPVAVKMILIYDGEFYPGETVISGDPNYMARGRQEGEEIEYKASQLSDEDKMRFDKMMDLIPNFACVNTVFNPVFACGVSIYSPLRALFTLCTAQYLPYMEQIPFSCLIKQ